MSPNSNSDSSTLRSETRCADDTMPADRGGAADGGVAGFRGTAMRFLTLMFYR
jgi:hypothetical protein